MRLFVAVLKCLKLNSFAIVFSCYFLPNYIFCYLHLFRDTRVQLSQGAQCSQFSLPILSSRWVLCSSRPPTALAEIVWSLKPPCPSLAHIPSRLRPGTGHPRDLWPWSSCPSLVHAPSLGSGEEIDACGISVSAPCRGYPASMTCGSLPWESDCNLQHQSWLALRKWVRRGGSLGTWKGLSPIQAPPSLSASWPPRHTWLFKETLHVHSHPGGYLRTKWNLLPFSSPSPHLSWLLL